jgi:hypothetical protein
LGAPVLFSHKRISDALDPAVRGPKKALELHHIFPREWLRENVSPDVKVINQAANYALLEWPDFLQAAFVFLKEPLLARLHTSAQTAEVPKWRKWIN